MKTVERFLDDQGRVSQWPTKRSDKDQVLDYLSGKFSHDEVLTEAEFNERLKQWHTFSDWPLLRRELYESGRFDRNPDGTGYRKTA